VIIWFFCSDFQSWWIDCCWVGEHYDCGCQP